MHPPQYLNLLSTNREGFQMNTVNKNPIVVDENLSFIQRLTSSPLVFDSVKKK